MINDKETKSLVDLNLSSALQRTTSDIHLGIIFIGKMITSELRSTQKLYRNNEVIRIKKGIPIVTHIRTRIRVNAKHSNREQDPSNIL